MKIDNASVLYTATSIAEKTAAEIKEQPKVPSDLQDDNVALSSSGPVDIINSAKSRSELPLKPTDTE